MNTSPLSRDYRFPAPAFVARTALILFALCMLSGCSPRQAARDEAASVAGDTAKPDAVVAERDGGGGIRKVTTRVTMTFPGGTLGDLRNHLPAPPNAPFNLIVGDEFAAIPVPAFAVRDADSSQLARALSHQLYPKGVTIEAMDMMPEDSGGAPVYVTYSDPDNRFYGRVGDLRFRSVEMGPEAAARFAPALQNAWAVFFQSTAAPVVVRYHAETRQLFVSGPGPAMTVFDEVMGTFVKTSVGELEK